MLDTDIDPYDLGPIHSFGDVVESLNMFEQELNSEDYDGAHIAQDEMYVRVLKYIAQAGMQGTSPAMLATYADYALQAEEHDFPHWYS